MSAEKMREQYDAWYAREVGALGTLEHKKWFTAWAASRAAIEVELPCSSEFDSPADCNQAIRECREAIESLGLKVKP